MPTKEIVRFALIALVTAIGSMGMAYIFWNVYVTDDLLEKVFMIVLSFIWPFLCIALVARLTKVKN